MDNQVRIGEPVEVLVIVSGTIDYQKNKEWLDANGYNFMLHRFNNNRSLQLNITCCDLTDAAKVETYFQTYRNG
jgi:hypothetical protein